MFEEIKSVFAKQFRIDEDKITLNARLKEDLGADSLDLLELLMTLESDYGIAVPDDDIATFKTVGDVVRYVDSKK